MSGSRFGYPRVDIRKYSNEQNMQNVKSYMFNMSDEVEHYIGTLEDEIEELKSEIAALKNG